MDVISKDEPFRCESFSFFEQLGRKLIFFFLHKRSIFAVFPIFPGNSIPTLFTN